MVRLSDVEEHAQQVLALASGGKERIYALFTGPTGEGIAEVNRSGEVHSLVSSPSAAIWVDMVALP